MKNFHIPIGTLGLILLSGCSPEIPETLIAPSKLTINCPDDIAIRVVSAPVSTDFIDLPKPDISSTCDAGTPSFSNDAGAELPAGVNIITCNATDSCGNKESCSFKVEVIVDFRAKFVGTYKGFRDCYGQNVPQLHPDQSMTFTVSYGNKPNYLLVGTDQVEVNTSGTSLSPNFGDYRRYGVGFKADSIYVLQEWGALNSHETCEFRGIKEK